MDSVDSAKWEKKMEETIDEWKAIDLLLGLTKIYSNLSPVWIEETEKKEEIDALTVKELQFRLIDLIAITPKPFRKKLKQIYDNLKDIYIGPDEKSEIVLQDSEIGKEIFAVIEELCDFLKNSWRKLYKMEELVLEVFPPFHFDFRSQIRNLNREYIHYDILELLEKAVSLFNEKEYVDCINCCGEASEKLTESLFEYLELKCERNWRRNLDTLYKNLKSGVSSIDLHWLICYLLQVVYFMRNPHSTKATHIPQWMDYYQKLMRKNHPRWARIALICSLEASEVFQEIREHL